MGNDVGKVVGGIAGGIIAGPVGIAVGVGMGAAADHNNRNHHHSSPSSPAQVNVIDEKLKAKAVAMDRLCGFNRNKTNIAICGGRGKGKSSIVNGIRRVLDGSEGAASVNECEETMKPTPYPHPERSDLILWDLPGGGTPNHPIESYFDDKSLLAFDCIVLVCDEVFGENDIYLAEQATKAGVPVIAVRNKANNALQARLRRSSGSDSSQVKARLIEELRDDISRNLATKSLDRLPVFVINCWRFTDSNETPFEEVSFEQKLFSYIK